MVRGLVSMLVVGTLLLAAVAFAILRPAALQSVLPVSALALLGGTSDPAQALVPRGTGDAPADFLVDTADGLMALGSIAAGPGNAPVFIDDVISGYSLTDPDDVPAEITTIRPILGCRLTPPRPGTLVGHAVAGRSGMPTAMATYNDTDLAAAVQAFVDAYRAAPGPEVAPGPAPAYEAYDIAVTETSAPVYLVLENTSGNRLWNIHLAEGARIERVVLLGGRQAGVANLDPVVPVEVLLGAGLDDCGIRPAYRPNEGNAFFRTLGDGSLSAVEAEMRLAAMLDAVDRYDVWFHDSFGLRAGESRIGYDAGTISVIGPVPVAPQPRAVYAPIRGADLRMTQDSFFEIAGQVPEGEDFPARIMAIARAFAFGDLQTLRQGVQF